MQRIKIIGYHYHGVRPFIVTLILAFTLLLFLAYDEVDDLTVLDFIISSIECIYLLSYHSSSPWRTLHELRIRRLHMLSLPCLRVHPYQETTMVLCGHRFITVRQLISW